MRTFASDVSGRQHKVVRQFFLDVQVPLLNVRPNGFVRNGNNRKWKEWNRSTIRTDARVAAIRPSGASVKPHSDVGLRRGKNERWGAFQRFGVAFVAVGMFVEDTVAAADGHLAVSLGIKRESDPWCRIEEVAFQAACVGGRSNANGGEI